MAIETLQRPGEARHPDEIDGELLGEPGVMRSAGYKENPDDIVDAEIVEENPADEGLVVTKRPTGALEGSEAGAVEQSFTPEDMEKFNHMLAQEALRSGLPASQGATQPTKLKFVTLDQSHDAEATARRIAEQTVKEKAATIEGGRTKQFVKKAWRNLAAPYTYQKARTEALNAIKEHGNLYAVIETTDEKRQAAHEATFSRVTSEDPEMRHSGERYEDAKNDKFVFSAKDLIRRNVNGELSDEALEEEMQRLRTEVRSEYGTKELGKGVARIDNLLYVVQAVKGAVEHGESLEVVLENMEVKVGEARAGVRQESRGYKLADKLADKLHTSRVLGSVLGPEAVGTVVGTAAVLGHFATSKAVTKGMHVAGLAGGAGGAAGLAAVRERAHLNAERAHHHEERAQGKEFEAGEKMEEFAYELADNDELVASLNFASLDLETSDGIRKALEYLGHVEARVGLTDAKNINLIKYADEMDVSDQRWELDIARAEAKCKLRPLMNGDPAVLQELGLGEGATFDEILDGQTNAAVDVLMEDVDAKDRAFKKYRRWQATKAATVAGISSLTFGLVSTEVTAAFLDKTTGLAGKIGGSDGQDETVLAALAGKLGFGGNGMPIDGATSFADRSFGGHGSMTMPEGMNVQSNPDGTVNVAYGEATVNNLPLEKNGTFSPEALARLHEEGFQISDLSHVVDTPETKTVHGGSLHDFMQAHRSQTEHVTRVGWSDNDTVRPDENELKIWWGGEDNNGIRPGGGFQFDITQMTTGGSSHDGINENWKELAKKGELKMFISPSDNEQTHPFTVNIGPDGKVDIPENHPAAKFFSIHDGQARFDGKYAEVAQVVGENDKGATEIRPLATEVGNDTAKNEDYTYTEKTKKEAFKPVYNVRLVGSDGSTIDYHAGPGVAPHTFAKPARPRPMDVEGGSPAPITPGEPQGELSSSVRPELGSAWVQPELEAPRPRAIEVGPARDLEVARRPEAPAIEHRDRATLAAARPHVWSPFWQGEINKAETPAIEAPAAEQQEQEGEQDSDVEFIQNAAREALKSGKVSVSEMEQIFRHQFGAGGVYITVLYDQGRPVDYNVHVTDLGAQRLKSMLNVRQTLEGSRRPAIEMGPATPELES